MHVSQNANAEIGMKKILQALGLIKRPQFSTFRERLPALQQCLTIGFLAMCDR